MITYKDIKDLVKIDVKTGRAVLPDYEFGDIECRDVDINEFDDKCAVSDLLRRMNVLQAMNTIIRNANNENIRYGEWLYAVDDGSKGLDFAYYTNDSDYFEIVHFFKDIVSEYTLMDLTW